MDTSNPVPGRGGRWLVTGVLGLAVLGATGCATDTGHRSQPAGPAVVLDAPSGAGGLSRPPTEKVTAGSKADSDAATTSVGPDDRTTKQVPAAKPKAIESPNTPKSPNTGKTPVSPPSARTP